MLKPREYDLVPTNAECPVCRHNSGEILYTVSAEQAAQHFIRYEAMPERHRELTAHILKIWGRPDCSVIRCGRCGFCFSLPFVAGDERFYELAYDRTGYPSWKWEHQLTRDSLVETIGVDRLKAMRLLEIGAGDGAFVAGVSRDLFAADNILCTEYSEYGRQSIEKSGIRCLPNDICESPNMEREIFNVICLFQVLEHYSKLEFLFERINGLSAPEALMYISVPNDRYIEFIERWRAQLDMPPNHVGRWNGSAMGMLAGRHGWEILKHRYQTNETYGQKARKFLIYRFFEKSHTPGSIANYSMCLKRSNARRLLQALLAGAGLWECLLPLKKLRNVGLGSSQWFCLRKTGR